jgi:hypothetical protein
MDWSDLKLMAIIVDVSEAVANLTRTMVMMAARDKVDFKRIIASQAMLSCGSPIDVLKTLFLYYLKN